MASDLLEARAAIEALVARQAAERATDGELAALRAVVTDGLAAVEREEWESVTELNAQFHLVLGAASHNPVAEGIVRQLRDRAAWIYAANVAARAASSWSEHELIVVALERRDPVAAVRAIEHHIRNAGNAVRDGP